MSRGLGKVQRAILDKMGGDWWDALDVIAKALHPERFDNEGAPLDEYFRMTDGELRKRGELAAWALTRSEYTSALRAIVSLKRRGLVQTEMRTFREGKRAKMVKLCVDPPV